MSGLGETKLKTNWDVISERACSHYYGKSRLSQENALIHISFIQGWSE